MSKKLFINFSATKWEYINWSTTRNFISRLQYRIYISAFQQKYKKMRCIQKKLITSPYARLLSVSIVSQYYTNFEEKKLNLSGKQKLTIAKNISLQDDRFNFLNATKIRNVKQYRTMLNFVKQVQQLFAELILKPEWLGKSQKTLYKYILDNFSVRSKLAKIIRIIRTGYYTEMLTLDFAMYITHGNYLGVMKKLSKFQPSFLQEYIKTWLQKENLLAFKTRKNLSNNLLSFLALKKINLAIYVILSFLIDELVIWLLQNSLQLKVKLFVQNSQLIFLYNNSYIYKRLLEFIRSWLLIAKIDFRLIQISSNNINKGFHCLGFKLKIHQYLILTMLRKSQVLLWRELSQIIQKSKSSSIHQLIRKLSPFIAFWGSYFEISQCSKMFSYLDYLLHLKIWSWLRRRYPFTSKNKIFKTYYVQNKLCFLYNKHLIKSSWILCTQETITSNRYFLLRFMWIKCLMKTSSEQL